jgi:subtilase family serine protease
LDATTGAYQSESGWTQVPGDLGASGGGFSTTFARPAYQDGVKGIGASRGLPDVVSDGDFFTRMVIAYTVGGTVQFGPSGGTASATPQWAGIIALADQFAGHRLGFVNTALYRLGQSPLSRLAFHDITTGNNSFAYTVTAGGPITTIQGYSAAPGWDAVTGLGSPRTAELIPLLVRSVHQNDGCGL